MSPIDAVDDSWNVAPVGRVAAPLREKVISALRQAILDFELKPGQRLVERELIERLGVSRTTVREALRDLASEGLVSVVPQRGAIVATPSIEEAADLYEIRAILESLVVRHFVERAADDAITRLFEAVDEVAVISADGDVRSMLAAKDRFYSVLFTGANSPALQQLLEGLKARVQVLRATSLSEPGRPQEVVAELRAITEAVGRRDAELAARLCAAHVRRAARAATDALRESTTDQTRPA
jgi:DNA-binding GntR family transcriptional regulator